MSFSVVCPKVKLAQLQLEIAPGFVLAKATADQCEQIRKFVGDARFFGWGFRTYFECELQPTEKEGQVKASYLAPEHWHYHVVNFLGTDTKEIEILQHALNLMGKELILGITILDHGGSSHHATKLTHMMLSMLHPPAFQTVHELTASNAAWISRMFQKVKAVVDDKAAMLPLNRLQDLLHLPLFSTAHVLGLFSVLEMVLTHQQRDKNLHDSITHQVATKMPLLNRKFERSAPYDYFPNTSQEDVWKALYEYRSRIAHGNEYDFGTGKLSKLGNESLAHGFLNDAVRLLLRFQLDEPALIADLKKC